jgi:hypothetical protein
VLTRQPSTIRLLKIYLNRHKYNNTNHNQLWNALSEAMPSQKNGQRMNITQLATPWTEQKGYPLVEVRRFNGTDVAPRQHRFIIEMSKKTDDSQWYVFIKEVKLLLRLLNYWQGSYLLVLGLFLFNTTLTAKILQTGCIIVVSNSPSSKISTQMYWPRMGNWHIPRS